MAKSEDSKSAGCDGTIKPGGNPFRYMGHFIHEKFLEKGHNQGEPGKYENSGVSAAVPPVVDVQPAPTDIASTNAAPVGSMTPGGSRPAPAYNPETNPMLAARQQNRAARQSTRLAGGDMAATRATGRENLIEAKGRRWDRDVAGLHKSDVASAQQARGAANTDFRTRVQAEQQQQRNIGNEERNKLRTATAGLRESQQALRTAMRGGDATAAGKAFTAKQEAKTTRQAARKEVRRGRK